MQQVCDQQGLRVHLLSEYQSFQPGKVTHTTCADATEQGANALVDCWIHQEI